MSQQRNLGFRSSRLLGVFACGLLMQGCDREVTYPPGLSWGEPDVPDYVHSVRLAITNNGDDTLSYVSTDSLTQPRLLGTGLVGNNPIELEGPHHLGASPDGKFIYYNLSNYVINGGSGPHGAHGTGSVPGYLVKLDARTGRPAGQLLVDRSPGDIILSQDGKRAFVSHYDLARLNDQLLRGGPDEQGYSSLAIIDTDTMRLLSMKPICPTLHGMGLSPDEKRLYATCSLSDELAIVDISQPESPSIVAKVKVGPNAGPVGNPSYAPYALTVRSDGTVWISNNQSGDVRVYDPGTQQMDATRVVPIGGIAMFSAFSLDGSKLYVPRQNDDRLYEVDAATLAKRELALPAAGCLNAHAVTLLPGGTGAAVVCEGDHRVRKGSLIFVDLAAWTVSGQLELGLYSDDVEVFPALP